MKKTIKLVSVLLSVLMILSVFPFSVFAEESGTPVVDPNAAVISVDSAYGKAGTTVSVDISIINNPGILGMTLYVWYDEEFATLTSVTSGPALDAMTFTVPKNLASGCRLPWDAEDVAPEDVKDGVIATLTFKISDTAKSGQYVDVHVAYDYGGIIDRNINPLDIILVRGGIDILSYTPGDLNDNGIVDTTDVVLLRRYIAGGYGVNILEAAGDVNDDGILNTTDVVLIRRFIAGGYGVKLLPSHLCKHTNVTHTAAKAASCEESGNVEFWKCEDCGYYYSDAALTKKISEKDVVIAAKGHVPVVIPAVAPTEESWGSEEGSKCSVCGKILVEPTPLPPITPERANIIYKLTNNDSFLAQQVIDNPNPATYVIGKGLTLSSDITVPGYTFVGWFDSFADNATQIKSISASENKDITLYAHWTETVYNVTYKIYQTPLQNTITEDKYIHYTVSKGVPDLPNPTLYNYIFLGWYTDAGEEVTNIPAGTTGNISLNAYWTSKRYLAKSVESLKDPLVFEDVDNGVMYFAYELGTIENVPVSNAIWTIQSVSGLAQQHSTTVTTSTTQSIAETITNTISKSTVDSNSWTLSNDWNKTFHVDEEWANQHGMTVEEADAWARTDTNSISIGTSEGGTASYSKTNGLSVKQFVNKDASVEESIKLNGELNGKNSLDLGINLNVGLSKVKIPGVPGEASAGAGGDLGLGFELGWKVGGEIGVKGTQAVHTGTEATKSSTESASLSSTWNNSLTQQQSTSATRNSSVNQAVSDIISEKTGYGESIATGGEESSSRQQSQTDSVGSTASSTLTWSSTETKTTTSTYSTDGKSEGYYRLVLAGTAHVFGVVGYDVASHSYFTYTFTIMDDEEYEFLDYSSSSSFNDCQYTVLPFEIPYEVCEYVNSRVIVTDGVRFRTDTTAKTATVTGYSGTSEDVVIPAYITSGGVSYKVTGINASVFAGTSIRSIVLGKYIREIPDGAFKNCTSLEQVYGWYESIGAEAFSGCTSLERFIVPENVSAIGQNAFLNVPVVVFSILGKEYALAATDKKADQAKDLTESLITAAVNAGAKATVIDLTYIIDGCEIIMNVPAMDELFVYGDGRTFTNFKLDSAANKTTLSRINIVSTNGIPVFVASDEVTLDTSTITSSTYCLMLSKDANVSLIRDNAITSQSGKAIVCRNPNFVSEMTKEEDGNSVDGYLRVSGNIYYYGTVSGGSNVEFTNGNFEKLSEEEFNNYIKGSFTISFNANGGTVGETTRTVYCGVAIGTLPTPNQRTGYSFAGWFTAASGGTQVSSSTAFSTAEDVTLYAHWTANTYTVVFNANGGSGSMANETFTYNSSKALTSNTFTKANCVFRGWATSASATTPTYSNGQSVSNLATSGTVTLYAVWESISLNSTSVTLTKTPTSVSLNNTSATLATVAVNGYNNTIGLTASLTYSNPTQNLTASLKNATSSTVTWTSSNTSVVTVNNGVLTGVGTGTATITAKSANGAVATATVTVKKGSDTISWSSDASGIASVSGGTVTAVSRGSTTIRATANGKTATCAVTVKEAYKAFALDTSDQYAILNYNNYTNSSLFGWSSTQDCSSEFTFVTGASGTNDGAIYQCVSSANSFIAQVWMQGGKIKYSTASSTLVSNYTMSGNTKYTVVVTAFHCSSSNPQTVSIVIKDENGAVLDTTTGTVRGYGADGASNSAIGPKGSIRYGAIPQIKLISAKISGTQGSAGYDTLINLNFDCANLNVGTTKVSTYQSNGCTMYATFYGTSVQWYVR